MTEMKEPITTVQTPSPLADDCYEFVKLSRAGEGTEEMVREIIRFLNAMKNGDSPYVLTLSGRSGTGKTHCVKAVTRWYYNGGSGYIPSVDGCTFLKWGECLEQARSRNFGYLRHPVKEAGLLALDEIGGDLGTAMEKNLLLRAVDDRMGRWTILTTNQTLKSIAADIDYRLASRLVRNGNIVVENNDPDWCVEKWKEKKNAHS